ncbi:hypothetical protein KBB96_10960 [Luteolibacter ambystomatis]|uniref:DUF4198 domain-containing protein n=1 Tax=Luteolibacter ambystomatis TaxID=2824561 RepID=A0A975G604_9BACT|nr:hypothetical protein [Luteolibacter ambystomatis]QUE49391.1 hypothetical protein KBB96_10960 [Luteolibacter ambystomatis]
MFRPLIPGLIAALCPLLLHAQDAPAAGSPATEEAKTKGLKFQVSAWGDWSGAPLFAQVEAKKYTQLKIADMALTEAMPFKREEGITLYEKVEAKDGKEEGYKPKFHVTVPADIKTPLVLLLPGKDKQMIPRVYELDPSGYPAGAYRFVNLSPIPVLATVNETRTTVPPNGDKIVNRSPKADERVQITGTVMGQDGVPQKLFSTMAINRTTKRMMMFFYPATTTADSATLMCRSLVDFVEPAKP